MYLGNQPALSYTSFAKQDFSTSATTSYTLDNPVTNANELALFINFVRQEPTTAYSASGTTLTLTSATSASDDMYCVYLGKAVQTVNPPNASVGASQIVDSSIALGKLSATGTKDATTFLRGDNTFASAGGTNTPAFQAKLSSSQSISNATNTKVQFNSELFDTDNTYDNSTNYRFTPGVAGKYVLTAVVKIQNCGDQSLFINSIFKNGSQFKQTITLPGRNDDLSGIVTAIDVASATDYYEIFSYTNGGSSVLLANDTYFNAYKIIE